jgi:hypothetical protein
MQRLEEQIKFYDLIAYMMIKIVTLLGIEIQPVAS